MLKKSNLFIILLLVFCFTATGAAIYYKQTVQKQENIIMSAQNHIGDLRFQFKDFEKATPFQQPTEATLSSKGPGAGTSASVPQSAPRGSNNAAAKSTAQQQPSSQGIDPLRNQIEQTHISRLQALASGYEAKLNGLVTTAFNEINAAKKADPKADITPLVNKYYSAGKALEAECDSKFYAMLAAFESELRANSFPLDAAANAKETYEARKSARSGQVITGRQ